ncbi:MAG: membrane protein insertion efficiency factor YidD [Candidatus Omnitrophica bacterium]|nr:membrane protein insertion efficiency factor YidD [Candidatus Omnitrophota bacterium]MCF7892150.1 membrane protein insertion efficiency factor YidD [Candidatus Omnitrophota bacterium]MCF7897423.1 membrane protein insertion efficiency factor YidD [Candidatus Omnitrophota bacterium]MCF7909398.1 membrane protein insertion efficiency factor YidD [Candidatus Omnitrophota bacterium]
MNRVALFFIKIYQNFFRLVPGSCIYTPTCSEYAKQAFKKRPFSKALWLSLLRILRCNPFSQGGFDPVR